MTVTRIGDCAGALWTHLRGVRGGSAVTQLKKLPGYSGDEVLAALGWLAREGKITVKTQGKKTVVSLVEAELLV